MTESNQSARAYITQRRREDDYGLSTTLDDVSYSNLGA